MHPRVICLGEILFDCISNQPGQPLEAVTSWTSYPGGAPANVACALTKLGTPAAFVGCVGEDESGRSLIDLLKTTGVDITGIQTHPSAPTRTVLVLRSQTGDRSFVAFGENRDTAQFADTHLQADRIPVELFQHADYLVIGTLLLAYPESRAAIDQALQLAEQFFVKVVLDVNWRPVFWKDAAIAPDLIHDLMKRVDFVKFAEEEAEWLFETTDPGVIAHRLDLEGVLVTAGEKGCAYCLSEREGKIPAFKMEVEDTTGAGDSFLAGFIHQLCQRDLAEIGESAEAILQYATASGALTTLRPGAIAAQPTSAEVDAFLFLKQQGG